MPDGRHSAPTPLAYTVVETASALRVSTTDARRWRRALAKHFTIGPGCWEWTAYRNGFGYGLFSPWRGDGRISRSAHRAVWELHVGPIPPGMHLDHLCRNPPCVRPGHLEPVTPAENIRRMQEATGFIAPPHALLNAAKTQCAKGHPYDETNTYYASTGSRTCRTCNREAAARYRDKRRAA